MLLQYPISLHNMTAGISYKLNYREQATIQILTLLCSKGQYFGLIYFKKCHNNNNSDNSLTSSRTDGGKKSKLLLNYLLYTTYIYILYSER